MTVSPTQSQIQIVLRDFLLAILPAGTSVIEGQDNRVAEPDAADFVIFTATSRSRMATNFDDYADEAFVGSISGTVLTITNVLAGSLALQQPLFGANIATGTVATAQLTGTPGGIGTYRVNNSQTVTSETIQTGTESFLQSTLVVFQIDVHGPNSADNAEVISTMFRDDYAYQLFASSDQAPAGTVTPIDADTPQQIPFVNAESQYEDRWVISCSIQADQTISFPQEFATALTVGLIEVDSTYPA